MKLPLPAVTLPPLLLIPCNFAAGTLAALLLDVALVRPPDSGSITTLLPGLTYACATVMKVCLVAGFLWLHFLTLLRLLRLRLSSPPGGSLPRLATLSLALPPAAILLGALAAVAQQRFLLLASPLSLISFDLISRQSVFLMLAAILAGALCAAASLVRRRGAPAFLGLLVNAVLLALFLHLSFFAAGFHQDRWAP
ncbi:MAG: hypothetical protein HY821_14225 [Acidobacteria bacterium]|nr:hypothetical protein [Acidobacteriota bacterium]